MTKNCGRLALLCIVLCRKVSKEEEGNGGMGAEAVKAYYAIRRSAGRSPGFQNSSAKIVG